MEKREGEENIPATGGASRGSGSVFGEEEKKEKKVEKGEDEKIESPRIVLGRKGGTNGRRTPWDLKRAGKRVQVKIDIRLRMVRKASGGKRR